MKGEGDEEKSGPYVSHVGSLAIIYHPSVCLHIMEAEGATWREEGSL